jgi:hypothetical protein
MVWYQIPKIYGVKEPNVAKAAVEKDDEEDDSLYSSPEDDEETED